MGRSACECYDVRNEKPPRHQNGCKARAVRIPSVARVAADRAEGVSPVAVAAPATMHRPRNAPQLPALTGLRFVAASLVVIHHFIRHFRPGTLPVGSIIYAVFYDGNAAVGFFFALSGFILAYSYVTALGRFRTSIAAYLRARIARIYPVYLLAIALWTVSFLDAHAGWEPGHIASTLGWTLLLMQNWPQVVGNSIGYAWGGPAWSLSVEAFFYAAFPVLALLLARLRTRWLVLGWWLLWVTALAGARAIIASNCGGSYQPIQCGDIVGTLPISRLPEFLLGITVGIVFLRRREACAIVMRLPLGVCLLLAALLLAVAYVHQDIFAVQITYAPCWALLLMAGALGRGWAARMLASRPAVALGEASYSLYLLHWPIWYWLTRLTGMSFSEPAQASSILLCAAYASLCIAASLISMRWLEKPARDFIRKFDAKSLTARWRYIGL